jgi:glycosyltransferase involved in cell wall biosynthesis
MKLRVLWLQWRDIRHPWSGGAEVYMHEISRRLARRGVRVHAVTSWFPGLARFERLDGYTVERIGTHDDYALHVPHVLRHYSGWADVIVEDTSKIPLMTPLLRSARGTPVIAVVHHLNRRIYFRELPPHKALLAYILETMMPRLYSHVDSTLLVAVSRSTREELVDMGADPDRVFIVPNAVNPAPPGDPGPVEKDSRPTVIYFSRLKRYKQPHHALLAFAELLKRIPDARLVVAGKGTEALAKYARRLGIDHATEVYGEVDEETKRRLMCRSWVLIQTSRKEGFGIVVLEAAACGTPTVAYNVPGLRDSIRHMETGILVEPNNPMQLAEAVEQLLLDNRLRGRLSENAYRYARSFNWDRSTDRFHALLKLASSQRR